MSTYRLTSPLMRGPGVRRLQLAVNAQLRRWKVPKELAADGEFGPATAQAVREVAYGLGLDTRHELADGVPLDVRRKIHRPARRTPAERDRYRKRRGYRNRLVRRYATPRRAIAAAIAFARVQAAAGVREQPANSNRGGRIDGWLRLCGIGAAPWCGCFANAALMAGGFPAQPWLRYCPWIESRARRGEGGWSWHPIGDARPGDLVLYGRAIAVHVGLYIGSGVTIEGNTSSGVAGSQANGGGVYVRRRNFQAAGFPARGVARPPWRKVDA